MQPHDECLVYKDMQICQEEAYKSASNKGCDFMPACDKSCPGNRALDYASLLVLNPTEEPTELPIFYLVGSGEKVESRLTSFETYLGVVGFACAMMVGCCIVYSFPLWITGIYKAIRVYVMKKEFPPAPQPPEPPPLMVPKRPYNGRYISGGKHLVVGWTGNEKKVAPGKRLSLGETVRLRSGIPGDACLKQGEVGVIVADDHDGQPYQVLGEVSQVTGWYDEQQLVRIDASQDALPQEQLKAITNAASSADKTKRAWATAQTADSLIAYKKADSSLKYQLNVNSGLDDKPQEFVLKLDNFDMARVDRTRADPLGGAVTKEDKKQRVIMQPPQMKGRVAGSGRPLGMVSPVEQFSRVPYEPPAPMPALGSRDQYGGLGLTEVSSVAPPPNNEEERRIIETKSPAKGRTYD
jgi:hypothetical protein